MAFCLTKQAKENFKKALKDGRINPMELVNLDSQQRREVLAKFVGPENATQVNALFESKLLLKNQKAGYIAWAKKVGGITKQTRMDIISRISRLDGVLNPADEKAFLEDLASTKLGIEVTQAEAKAISDLSNSISEAEAKANKDGEFPSIDDRLQYGLAKVKLEKYINELKLRTKEISFKEHPLQKILSIPQAVPGAMKSFILSLDNSFWGRQGIKTLLYPPTAPIWTRNFLKSWLDFGKGFVGIDAIDAIRADIYSRPNALNGKYKAGGYGLDVLSEEAYPSSLPEKIPLLGRLFKASEMAYNGGALRIRADLADRLIRIAEKQGVNTLDSTEARAMGSLISSLTGRGSIASLTATGQQNANVLFTSVKFMKSNFDTLTAHQLDKKSTKFSRSQARKTLFGVLSSLVAIMFVAKMMDPDSVEEDPRSKNFGKIKLFGHWTDITGGMASFATLASQVAPTYNNGELGFWSKSKDGTFRNLGTEYGLPNALDVFEQFFEGKLSPLAGILRDVWKRKTYTGQDVTVMGTLANQVPLSIQQFNQFMNDPASTNVLGTMILETIGFSASGSVAPNTETKFIKTGTKMSRVELLQQVDLYAKAYGTDPETAWNKMFTSQKLEKVGNGFVISARNPKEVSQAEKKKAGKMTKEYKLDHTIPIHLGGDELSSNRKIIPTSLWKTYTSVENSLIRAVKAKKISVKDAQKLIVRFKGISDSKKRNAMGTRIKAKYK